MSAQTFTGQPGGRPVKGPVATSAEPGVFALLADGSTAEIRAASPEDFAAVRAMHAAMSPENLYLRFFGISRGAAEQEARRLCRPPGTTHAVLLAWLNGDVIGAASYEPGPAGDTAEVAFAVADGMHRRGIATLLLEHLVSLARDRQIRSFTAQTLSENSAMLRVFADAGLAMTRRWADGVVELSFAIPRQAGLSQDSPYLDAVAGREGRADVASLAHLLRPGSIAVVGAGRGGQSIGRMILRNIRGAGFTGPVYPVNPHVTELDGTACYPVMAALPAPAELAVIAVPPGLVPAAARDCGERGTKALIVITAGLDHVQEAELLAACRRYGMRLLGPNCLGAAVPSAGLDATFAAHRPAAGSAGVAVQSGGIGIALLDQLSQLGVGISSFASVGDKLDVSGNDLLCWWEQDGLTRLAVLYLESFGNPRKFARTARRVGRKMPVLTVHAGRSAPGQLAAASHTAAIAAPLITREALFAQAGIIATTGLGELLEVAAFLAVQPPPAGHHVAIVSNAGGAGVLAADACTEAGLIVHAMSGQALTCLREALPPGASVTGPVDTTAGVSEASFRACLEAAGADQGVSAVLALIAPTAAGDLIPAITSARVTVPITAVILGQPEAVRLLRGGGNTTVPAYAYPESAARALGRAAQYGAWLTTPAGTVPELDGIRAADGRSLIAAFLSGTPGGGWLPEAQTSELLRCYGIPLAGSRVAGDAGAAVLAAAELGYPVVLKAIVTGLVHKSDAGAVRLDLRTAGEVRAAFGELAATFGPQLSGALLQPMITGGIEVIMGIVQEPVFGPLLVFGLGGVATEVLGDHVARLAPLTDTDASSMIGSIRAAPLLLGHRGKPPADLAALSAALLRLSRLAEDLPEVAELDLNPVIARPDGVTVVDARIRVTSQLTADPYLRRLR
jgi:acyl-CoA synthetase (NDP forming)/GNAT superfamily N-acetyltransferase